MGYSPWAHIELDTTEETQHAHIYLAIMFIEHLPELTFDGETHQGTVTRLFFFFFFPVAP